MDRKKIIKIFGGFLAVMLAFTILSRAVSGAAMARVETVRMATGEIKHEVTGSGRVEAGREVAVYTETGQRVTEICVQEGESVEQGDVLFLLDMEKLNEQILQVQQEIEKIKLQSEDVQNAKAIEQRSQQTAKQRAQEDYNQAISQGDATVTEAKRAWDEAEQALQNFLNSSADTGSGGANDGASNTGKTDEQLEEDGTDRQSKENGADGQPGKNQSDGQLKEDQATDEEGTQGNQPGSQDNAAERETQKAALEQAVAEAKAAYDAAVSSRVDNIRTAARALEDAAMAKSTPDSSEKQNEITRKQQELTLNKLLALKDAGGEVKATVNGIVKQVLVTTGDLTSDGAAVRLSDTSEGGRLTVSVEKQYAEYLVTGSPVDLKPSGSKNVISDYTISSVKKNPQDDNLIDFTVDLPKDAIETGTYVDATIVPKSENYSTVIPLQALRGNQNDYYVLVLEEEQGVMGSELVVKRLDVQVVDKNSTSAALEEGLLTGEQEIISSSSRMIQEGSKVRRMNK